MQVYAVHDLLPFLRRVRFAVDVKIRLGFRLSAKANEPVSFEIPEGVDDAHINRPPPIRIAPLGTTGSRPRTG
ncbi:MAG: hypothetical protein ACK559_14690, partial [bacterium]